LLFFFSCALLNFPFDKDILEMGNEGNGKWGGDISRKVGFPSLHL